MPLLIAAFGQILAFVFKQIVVKFILFSVIFLLVTQLAPLLTVYLPDGEHIAQLFDFLPPALLWFLSIAAFEVTFPMIIFAYFTRFFIRRIPFIG